MFVQCLISSIDHDQKEQFTVLNKQKEETLFIDQGVYTKNRNFRLYLSSKIGKSNPFENNEKDLSCAKKISCNNCDKTLFFRSLVMNIPKESKIIPFDPTYVEQRKESSNKINEITNIQISPYPDFDQLIVSIIEPGKIKKVKFFENVNTQKPVVIYDVSGYRYCQNIGRSHKSNNIYFVANIMEQYVQQKCHDPMCSDFISKAIPLKSYSHDPVFDDNDNPVLLLACSGL